MRKCAKSHLHAVANADQGWCAHLHSRSTADEPLTVNLYADKKKPAQGGRQSISVETWRRRGQYKPYGF